MQDSYNSTCFVCMNSDAVVTKGQRGGGPIFLTELDCSETDASLLECRAFSPVGLHDCDHSQDVGVRCRGKKTCQCHIAALIFGATFFCKLWYHAPFLKVVLCNYSLWHISF